MGKQSPTGLGKYVPRMVEHFLALQHPRSRSRRTDRVMLFAITFEEVEAK